MNDNSTNSSNGADHALPQPDNDPLLDATEEIIIRAHLDKGRKQPGDTELRATAISWSEHFRNNGIDAANVSLVYVEAVKLKAQSGSGFMVDIADLIQAWEFMLSDGFWESQNTPEDESHEEYKKLPPGTPALPGDIPVNKAPKFVQSFQKYLQAGGETICCDCGESAIIERYNLGYCWICPTGKCEFWIDSENLMSLLPTQPPDDAISADNENTAPEPTPTLEDELIILLGEKCGMTEAKLQKQLKNHTMEEIKKFARFFEFHTPIDNWDATSAREAWKEFFDTSEVQNAKS